MRLELNKPVPLGDGGRIALTGYASEAAAGPGDAGSHAAGAGVSVRLRVAGEDLALDVPAAYRGEQVGWTSAYRVRLGAHGAGPPPFVDVLVDRIDDAPAPGSARTVRVDRGGTAPVGAGLSLRFLRHRHKVTFPGAPDSPLIVDVEYRARDGRSLGEESYALQLPAEREWRWRDHRFRLRDYAYDRFMVLEISRLALVPVSPPRP